MPDRHGYYTPREAVDAAEERGKIVARVYCGEGCSNGTALGVVRRSSMGYVFDAPLPSAAGLPTDVAFELLDAANEAGVRLPVPGGARGRCVVLLEQPRRPGADTPAVMCGTHDRLDPGDLLDAVRRRGSGAARVVAHRDAL